MSKLGRRRRSRGDRIAGRIARTHHVQGERAQQELERIRFWERLAAEPPAER